MSPVDLMRKVFNRHPVDTLRQDAMERYSLWRSLLVSYRTLDPRTHRAGRVDDGAITTRRSYLTRSIVLSYIKNFFHFPFLFLSFLIPAPFKGKVNFWTNLKTILTQQEFRPLRLGILVQIGFLYAVGHLGYITFVYFSNQTLAATYNWVQTSWDTSSTTASANHTDDRTGWTTYHSASSTMSVGNDVFLSFTIATSSDTTDEDFSLGTTSTVGITGSGTAASLVLLKPGGATCSTGTECNSGVCDEDNLCYEPPCVGLTSIDYEGQTYDLVEIGTQCWFAEHLNVGTKLASAGTMPSNNSVIEKWCYNNSDPNCTNEGGLYTWAEALQLDPSCDTASCSGSVTADHQGICPAGWHIPTDDEYKLLEVSLGMCTGGGSGCVDASGWRGTDQGTQLKVGGSSGFAAVLSGRRTASFYDQGSLVSLWSASEYSSTSAWRRYMVSSNAQVYRDYNPKTRGFAVRCIKN